MSAVSRPRCTSRCASARFFSSGVLPRMLRRMAVRDRIAFGAVTGDPYFVAGDRLFRYRILYGLALRIHIQLLKAPGPAIAAVERDGPTGIPAVRKQMNDHSVWSDPVFVTAVLPHLLHFPFLRMKSYRSDLRG